MSKAEVPKDEDLRLATLRECCVLDTPPEADFDDLSQLAAELSECPIALVSLVDCDRQWFKSAIGVNVRETSRELAFCAHAILREQPFIVGDASIHPLTCDNGLVTGPPHIRFYAGFPLRVSNRQSLGTLCVIDTVPRALSEDTLRRLKMLARQAASQLELRRLTSALTIARDQAQKSDRLKSEFVANMSHEIRTPLTAILGYSDVLMETAPSGLLAKEDYAHAVGGIRRNGDHLLSLVNDILDLAKIEAGKLDFEPRRVSPTQLAQDVILMLRSQADAKKLKFEMVVEGEVPESIVSDPKRMRQILNNLLGNAIKFTEIGSVRVTLGCDQAQNEMWFAIRDTGIGISESQLACIEKFEAFYQADASISRRYGGTGLGLKICQLLIGLLAGRLNISSEVDKGSVFTVVLPIGEKLDTRYHDTIAPAIANSASTNLSSGCSADDEIVTTREKSLTGVRILIAEDGIDNQRLLRYFLKQAGADPVIVNNGFEALETLGSMVQTRAPDLILMDLEMPVMDGMTAMGKIKQIDPSIPVVALTAHATEEIRRQCLQKGFDHFLTKPFEKSSLVMLCEDIAKASRRRTYDAALLVD